MYPFYDKPPDYIRSRNFMFMLKGMHKEAEIFEIGKSVLGREIFAVSLGKRDGAVLYAGGFHASEWLTVLLLQRFSYELLEAWEKAETRCGIDIRRTIDNAGVVIVPCINPDGTEIVIRGPRAAEELEPRVRDIMAKSGKVWQANARGVDLNHNFDAGWEILQKMEREKGITGPSPRQYGGMSPMSEPETRALCRLCKSHRFRQVMAFHSQGEEIFYQYGEKTPARSRLMAELFSLSSGYKMIRQQGLASHGGFKDWFIQEFARPGFTVEIGKGENPLPISDFPGIYDKILEMMLLGLVL